MWHLRAFATSRAQTNKITGKKTAKPFAYLAHAVLLLLICLFGVGCVFDSGELWRDDPYVVLWLDTDDNVALYFDLGKDGAVGRVQPKVVAVGSDDNYVVVKQVGTRGVNYFYLDRTKDHKLADPKDSVFGPFSESDFDKKRKDLTLPTFSKQFN